MNKKILFISVGNQTFIQNDISLLSESNHVSVYSFVPQNGFKNIVEIFKQFIFLSFNINKFQVVYVWFGDYHSFFPLLFAKFLGLKSILVIGGYDAEKSSDLNYGVHLSTVRSFSVKKSCDWATCILPVSHISAQHLQANLAVNYANKIKVVYNLIDSYYIDNQYFNTQRLNQIITVISASTISTLKVKGIDFYLELARSMPEMSFVVIGLRNKAFEYVVKHKTDNVEAIGFVNKQDLKSWYQQSKIVCQFSKFESFGVALGEGMASGCVPITFSYLGANEVVDAAFGCCIDFESIDLAQKAIKKGIENFDKWSNLNAKRVAIHFTAENRKKALDEIFSAF